MHWQRVVPITVIVAFIVLLGYGLTRQARQLPSVFIDEPVPEFSLLTIVSDRSVLTDKALIGQVTMINFWASWCVPCRIEHPQITAIAQRTGVPVVGINYSDTRANARQWLTQLGNPFAVIGFDKQAEVGFDFGVSGIPETFIVDANGVIRHKFVGPITEEIMKNEAIPMLRRLKGQS